METHFDIREISLCHICRQYFRNGKVTNDKVVLKHQHGQRTCLRKDNKQKGQEYKVADVASNSSKTTKLNSINRLQKPYRARASQRSEITRGKLYRFFSPLFFLLFPFPLRPLQINLTFPH